MIFRKTTNRRKRPSFSTLGIPVFAIAGLALLSPLSAETRTVAAPGGAQNIQAVDQRLMDAERALLHSLSARTLPSQRTQDAQKVPASEVISSKTAAATTNPVSGATVNGAAVTTVTEKAPSSPKVATERKTEKNTVKPLPVAAASTEATTVETTPAKASTQTTQATKVAAQCGDAEILKNSNGNLRRELQIAHQRVEELERSLDQARSQLALTETELSRLSTRLESKNMASLGKYNLPIAAPAVRQFGAAPSKPDVPRSKSSVSEVRPPAANTDLPIATVAVDKADLRLGPGKNNSALMAVSRGSRLVVETRQGEWYRVFAPSGERAWIHSGMVLFGDGASLLNDGTAARVKGFNPNDEEEAFRRVQRMAAGQ